MSRSIRPLARLNSLPGGIWKIVVWKRVLSWKGEHPLSLSNGRVKKPSWEEYFLSPEVAKEYMEKIKTKFPERQVEIYDSYVLTNDDGLTGHRIRDVWTYKVRRSARINKQS
jgi:hypothetical protein